MKHIKKFNDIIKEALNTSTKAKVIDLRKLSEEQLKELSRVKGIKKELYQCDAKLNDETIRKFPYLVNFIDSKEFTLCKLSYLDVIKVEYDVVEYEEFLKYL